MKVTRVLKAAATRARVAPEKAIQIIKSSKRICNGCKKKLSAKHFSKSVFEKSLLSAECKTCKNGKYRDRKKSGYYALPHDNKDLAMDEVLSISNLDKFQGSNVIMLGANRVKENAIQINKHVPRLKNFHSVEVKKEIYRSAVASSAHLTMGSKKIKHKLYHGRLIQQIYQSDIEDSSVGLFHIDLCGNVNFNFAVALTQMIEKYGSDSTVLLLTTPKAIRYGKFLLRNPFKEMGELLQQTYFEIKDSCFVNYRDGKTTMSLNYFHLHF